MSDHRSNAQPPAASARALSQRGDVEPFRVMDVLKQADALEQAGRHIVHWEVGQPSSSAPLAALERLSARLANESFGYGAASGSTALRERIQSYYHQHHGLLLEEQQIHITTGSSGAFQLAFLACFDVGDRVALSLPCYPSYRNILQALGLEVVYIETSVENGYQPTASDVARCYAAQPFDGLMIASPSNPVGSIMGEDDLLSIAQFCEANAIQLISDEIYHRLEYNARSTSAVACSPAAISINSMSKYYSMTGWRVGWMITPLHMSRQIEKLAQNLFICAPSASQALACEVLDNPELLERYYETYRLNREALLRALPKMGLNPISPDGAFYLWIDVSHLTDNSQLWCQHVLEETGIAITPGVDFDPKNGQRYIRIAYPRSSLQIDEGIERLARWFAGESIDY